MHVMQQLFIKLNFLCLYRIVNVVLAQCYMEYYNHDKMCIYSSDVYFAWTWAIASNTYMY